MRNTRQKAASLAKRSANIAVGISAAAVLLMAQTSTTAYQDIAGLFGKSGPARWLMYIEEQPGETVLAANSATLSGKGQNGIDPIVTGSLKAPLKVATMAGTERIPQTINRTIKGSRVVSTTMKQPPAYFSAGSVLERQSLFQPLDPGKKLKLAFVEPRPNLEALQIAAAFQSSKPAPFAVPKRLPVMVASLVEESRGSVLGYAPEPDVSQSPFAAVLKSEGPINLTPRLGKGDHAWAADPLPKQSFSKTQQDCLARGIYFEARGESVRGQAAVAQVVLNRVRNPQYPNSICGVVYQNKNWRNRCQFSFACDRVRDKVNNPRLWNIAKLVAGETTAGRIWLPQVGSSTHYHAAYVRPRWARSMKRVGRIGLHIFYRTYGGGWS